MNPTHPDRRTALGLLGASGALFAGGDALAALPATGAFEDVRAHGARGDGTTVDSPAINRAIAAVAARGGGTVLVPPGRYLSFSIRLVDNITLYVAAGATIIAASPDTHGANYDPPENYLEEQFQDFGITHVHNSLIYADGASNIALLGEGMLHGLGLDRAGPNDRWHQRDHWQSATALGIPVRDLVLRDPEEQKQVGRANKTIGLRDCRNVRVAGLTILQAGHFALIAHGCSNLTADGLTIDTDRDGIDIDCCRGVRVVNCTVNSPKDDAIVLKSSGALGRPVITEDVLVANCRTSGFLMGSVLDGTYRPTDYGRGPFGRIKMGTETIGGYRNIRIADCVMNTTRGILVGIVDGGTMEDVSISGIVMHDPVNHPLFIHLGARQRAPRGTPVGTIRRVRFSDILVSGADGRYPCGVEGLNESPIEDASFSNIDVTSTGGGTEQDASLVPEYRHETSLEVNYLRTMPAAGFYARNARRLTLRDSVFRTQAPDARPTVWLSRVAGGIVDGVASSSPAEGAVSTRDSTDVAIGDLPVIARDVVA
ncbi:glycosyl hydrolase family 28-related protein (plasmid) [Croceibacterium sp. TMG7-5b_MA50]|uniref:rhamnogalacturonidase n=1 Tax=Croceibacterium sp. TMG7-5b_MA50 TaxID=3121290 RepID=UPI003221E5CA